MSAVVIPQLAIPTDQEAISRVNRWLHREVGMFLHSTTATFDPISFFGTCRLRWLTRRMEH